MSALDDPAPDALAAAQRTAEALERLAPADLLRLKRVAQLRARTLPGVDWDDLLSEALLRALDGSRHWPEGVPLLAFLAGIMRSIMDHRAHDRRRSAAQAIARLAEPTPPGDAALHARQCLLAIDAHFAGDPDVRWLIAAHAGAAEPTLPAKRREAARKRLARAILRGDLDGWLP